MTALIVGLAVLAAAAAGGCDPGRPVASATPSPSATISASSTVTVTSAAFREGGAIPTAYSCRGSNQPPPLAWTGVPTGAAALALVLDDPDAVGGLFIHWVVSDIPPNISASAAGQAPASGRVSVNTAGQLGYLGPCPPAGTGVHRYRFTVYALSRTLGLAASTPASSAVSAIEAASVGQGRLVGIFSAS